MKLRVGIQLITIFGFLILLWISASTKFFQGPIPSTLLLLRNIHENNLSEFQYSLVSATLAVCLYQFGYDDFVFSLIGIALSTAVVLLLCMLIKNRPWYHTFSLLAIILVVHPWLPASGSLSVPMWSLFSISIYLILFKHNRTLVTGITIVLLALGGLSAIPYMIIFVCCVLILSRQEIGLWTLRLLRRLYAFLLCVFISMLICIPFMSTQFDIHRQASSFIISSGIIVPLILISMISPARFHDDTKVVLHELLGIVSGLYIFVLLAIRPQDINYDLLIFSTPLLSLCYVHDTFHRQNTYNNIFRGMLFAFLVSIYSWQDQPWLTALAGILSLLHIFKGLWHRQISGMLWSRISIHTAIIGTWILGLHHLDSSYLKVKTDFLEYVSSNPTKNMLCRPGEDLLLSHFLAQIDNPSDTLPTMHSWTSPLSNATSTYDYIYLDHPPMFQSPASKENQKMEIANGIYGELQEFSSLYTQPVSNLINAELHTRTFNPFEKQLPFWNFDFNDLEDSIFCSSPYAIQMEKFSPSYIIPGRKLTDLNHIIVSTRYQIYMPDISMHEELPLLVYSVEQDDITSFWTSKQSVLHPHHQQLNSWLTAVAHITIEDLPPTDSSQVKIYLFDPKQNSKWLDNMEVTIHSY